MRALMLAVALLLAAVSMAAPPVTACHPSFTAGDPDAVAVAYDHGCPHDTAPAVCIWLPGLRLCEGGF